MRRSYHDAGWLVEDTNYMGINMGFDWAAEHEWGISDLYKHLGIDNNPTVMGIERRMIKAPKEDFIKLLEEDKSIALIGRRVYEFEKARIKTIDDYSRELVMYDKDTTMVCAWSGNDFGIRISTKDEQGVKRLKRLHKAIVEKDAAVWLGGRKFIGNAGLCIGIVSHIPEAYKKQMYDSDVDYVKLQEAAEKTGIRAKIDALNKKWHEENPHSYNPPFGYFALSPAWFRGTSKTKYKVMFWLNPQHQDINDSNWFTVEDLELWLEGKGPVIKAKKAR